MYKIWKASRWRFPNARPLPEANITFHLGGFDITGIEQNNRESLRKRRQPPRYESAASAVVRSRVENSIESGYGSRDRSWYQYFKGARSSIDRIFCIINRHSTPGTSTLTVHTAHVYTPHGYMYMHYHRDHYYCHPLPCLLSLPWPRVSGRMANLGDRIRATTAS